METANFKHGTADNIQCPCCKTGSLSVAILIVLEELRTHFKTPVYVTSGARCKHRNAAIGGAPRSEHLIENGVADAADIVVTDVSPTQVVKHLKELPYANLLGIGKYANWVHVDTRGYAARW